MSNLLVTMLLHSAVRPLAIFCAPVLGIWEAVAMAIVGAFLFGLPLLSILRRMRREEERLAMRRRAEGKDGAGLSGGGGQNSPPSSRSGNIQKS